VTGIAGGGAEAEGGGGGMSGTIGACAKAAGAAAIMRATAKGQPEERRVKIKGPLSRRVGRWV